MDSAPPTQKLPALLSDGVVEQLAPRLRSLAMAPGVHRLLIDAADLEDVSARGLGLLVAVDRLARGRGAHVLIVDVADALHPLFDAARLPYRARRAADAQ